jgi:AbrB family looped-hinge helix DNA binding protein
VEGGRLIIPAAFRKEMGLAKGDAVIMEMHGDELRVRPAKSALKRLRETFRGSLPDGVSVVDEFLAERRRDSGHE